MTKVEVRKRDQFSQTSSIMIIETFSDISRNNKVKGSSVMPAINVSPRMETLVKLNLIRLNLPRTRAPDAILVFNSAASRDEKMKGGKIFHSRIDNKASQKKPERSNNGNALRLTRGRERKQEETCKTSFVDYGLEQRKKKNIN